MLVIGELINATRKSVKNAITNKDAAFLQHLALQQSKAGAHYLDLNVATGTGQQEKEIEDMRWAIKVIRDVTTKPLAIDTTDYEVLKAALDVHGSGAMINSISAEKSRLIPFLRLAKEYNCFAIVLPIDNEGIPKDIDSRLRIIRNILHVAEKEGIPIDNLYFDPLVLPLGVEEKSAIVALKTLRALKKDIGVKTTVGLSNISFGLPLRGLLNRTFLSLAIYEGLDSVILNPLDKRVMSSLLATMLCLGNDPYSSNYLKSFRQNLLTN